METFTVKDIMKLKPCSSYTKEVVSKLWNNKPSLSLDEILNLNIKLYDRLWILAELVSTEILPNWANYCANKARIQAKIESTSTSSAIKAHSLDAARYATASAKDTIRYAPINHKQAAEAAKWTARYTANANWNDTNKELERLLQKLIEMTKE